MDALPLSRGIRGPLSLLVAVIAMMALAPAAAAEQRVTDTAAAGCGWPAGWSAGSVAFGTGYSSPAGSQRVREVQRRLKRAGARPGPVDGLFGPLTRAAVKRFQRRQDFEPTGVVGRRTLAVLRSKTGAGNDQRTGTGSADQPDTAGQSAEQPDTAPQSAPAPRAVPTTPTATTSSPALATILAIVLGLLLLAAAVVH